MDVLCVLTDTHGLTDVLCVLTDNHRQPRTSCVCWRTPTDVLCVLNRQPTWAKITQTVPGRASVLSPRTNVLICVLMDSHSRPVCADGHKQTHTDVPCVPTDTHGRPVCADGHPRIAESKDQRADMCTDGQPLTSCPQMSFVYWRTPTDVLCVLNRQPTWAKMTQTVHRKGQRAESKEQRADMCTDGQPRTSYGHTRTHTDSHRRPVCASGHPQTQPTWAKITQTVHGKGQRAESKDQRPDMCTDGQPRTSHVC
ncbi:unnamed protein product [Brassica rapa]|uniref:Uncharacterized protein n=1 Tax=Brassica campestris TaxID=3711 RepID=A0A8D9CXX3_BRACM|nr:unnamed protein product [Brassica rapa]